MNKIKVLLVDDHDLVIMGIERLLSETSNIKVVGTAKDGKEALSKIKKILPDIVILDIELPEISGIELTENITNNYPDIRIILHSSFIDEKNIVSGFEAGAYGYVPKKFKPKHLIEAITTVYNGNHYLKDFVSEIFFNSYFNNDKEEKNQKLECEKINLTNRELEILKLVTKGLANQDMADELFISVRTVEVHKANIMKKLKINNIAKLVIYAIKNNIIQL